MECLLRGSNAAKTLTETVFVLVFVAAASNDLPPPQNALLFLTVAAAGIGLTRIYAEAVRQRLELRRFLTRAEWVTVIREKGPPTIAVYLPMVILTLSFFGLAPVSRAFFLMEWSLVAILFSYGFVMGRVGGGTLISSVRSAVVVGTAGLLIVLLRRLI